MGVVNKICVDIYVEVQFVEVQLKPGHSYNKYFFIEIPLGQWGYGGLPPEKF